MLNANSVFVVDRDSSARDGLARLLRTAGHDVRPFTSLNDFLNDINPDISGCLVLDPGMPGQLTGDLRARLRAWRARLRMIVVSAHDSPETARKAQELGATGFFRKPVDGTALLDSVEWALRSIAADHCNEETGKENNL